MVQDESEKNRIINPQISKVWHKLQQTWFKKQELFLTNCFI